jgi:hypothetical protein
MIRSAENRMIDAPRCTMIRSGRRGIVLAIRDGCPLAGDCS